VTEDEFKAFLCRDGATWEQLAEYLVVVPCDCGEQWCQGWNTQMRPDYGIVPL
jgi:hypothetical protein